MDTEKVSSWVDVELLERLEQIRLGLDHRPTTQMIARLAVHEGCEAISSGRPMHVRQEQPGDKVNHRRPFTVNLPPTLFRRVHALSRKNLEASSPSAALRLLLWLGVASLEAKKSGQKTKAT